MRIIQMDSYLSIPISLISALRENSFLYNVYYVFSFCYLKIYHLIRKNRFDLYDLKACGNPYKNGLLVPHEEWELETPRDRNDFEKHSDNVFCFATNPDGDHLRIRISRLPNENVLCSVIIRTPDGREFHLPEEHIIQRSSSEENTFGSCRLKLQCLIPMRKWRIFFNGILEERNCLESEKYKHVKFTMLWTPSTDVFDFSYDMSKQIIMETAASQSVLRPHIFIQKLREIFDCYHHPGMFNGTMKIENECEKEVYLWGTRGKYMGNLISKEYRVTETFGSFKNGSLVFLGVIDIPGVLKSFPFGYLLRPEGHAFAIDRFESNGYLLTQNGIKVSIEADGHKYLIQINDTKSNKNYMNKNDHLSFKTVNILMNGKTGNGFVIQRKAISKDNLERMQSKMTTIPKPHLNVIYSAALTLPFSDDLCQNSSLTGGKGSSLAKLLKLSTLLKLKTQRPQFTVPNGIVVTTEAYKEFLTGKLSNLLKTFESDIWNQKIKNVPAHCKKIVNIVGETEIPDKVVQSILTNLLNVFGDSIAGKKFSVRSSATGEDTEQMSAAGQMETFLGVKSLNEILKSLAKCWASQFTFQAVEYKRRYGQKINTPMAVVIQEMISCEAAGVMFTCDPVTGNPSFISITGNFGLGESVVSGSAEPDTVILKKNINNDLQIHTKSLGNKKSCIVMDASSGTKEIEMTEEESASCCINQETSLKLGRIAIEIEKYYGSPQDTEWGIIGGNVFFFQSRPVTTIDMDTEFETKHFFDTAMKTNHDYFSKANVGEVVPGASTILGLEMMWKLTELTFNRQALDQDTQTLLRKPYFIKKLAIFSNHFLFSMLEGFFGLDVEPNDFSKAITISMFGRLIDDIEMRVIAKERFELRKLKSVPLWKKLGIVLMSFFAGLNANLKSKIVDGNEINVQFCSRAKEIFEKFSLEYDIFSEGMIGHLNCSLASSMWNLPILSLLAKASGEWDNKVFSDFSCLIKTSSNIISADVPFATEELALAISKCIDIEKFKKFSPEEAIEWLKTSPSEAGKKFKNFIKIHGHRCIKEFDVFSETWEMNPKPLVSTLQGLVSNNKVDKNAKARESIWKNITELNVKTSLYQKIKLLFIVQNARKAVQNREFSKSVLIKSFSKLRTPLHRLADLMVKEGRIPQKELMFFLCCEEIDQLLKMRSPRLVSRAFRRWKYHNELDKILFPEICVGIPRPLNTQGILPAENGFTMTGVPVSQGISKAPARVIMSVSEAGTIENGDILITYSTDIAWSPYFPRLSGVVTELGGLISHGAVVAREYGLPCVVALHGATKAFKTGDIVILDGNKGTLQRVE